MKLMSHLCLGILLVSLLSCNAFDGGIDAIELDIPVERLGNHLNAGASVYYRLSIDQHRVLYAAITLEEPAADILIDLLDENESLKGQTNLSGLNRSIYLALSQGIYYIRLKNNSSQFVYDYDLLLDAFELVPCGVISPTIPILELDGISCLQSINDSGFFFFDSIENGNVHISIAPQAELDILLEVYNAPILGIADALAPFQTKDIGLSGEIEELDISVSASRYFIRAKAMDIVGLGYEIGFDIRLDYSSQ